MILKKLLFILSLFISATVFSQEEATLTIKFNKSIDSGNLLVYIYDKAEGFPKRKDLAYKTLIIKANHTRQITIDNLPYNRYAIIIIHDENSNQKMDRNWMGMPGEPYALSKKTTFRIGPPKFKDVSFIFSDTNKVLLMNF